MKKNLSEFEISNDESSLEIDHIQSVVELSIDHISDGCSSPVACCACIERFCPLMGDAK